MIPCLYSVYLQCFTGILAWKIHQRRPSSGKPICSIPNLIPRPGCFSPSAMLEPPDVQPPSPMATTYPPPQCVRTCRRGCELPTRKGERQVDPEEKVPELSLSTPPSRCFWENHPDVFFCCFHLFLPWMDKLPHKTLRWETLSSRTGCGTALCPSTHGLLRPQLHTSPALPCHRSSSSIARAGSVKRHRRGETRGTCRGRAFQLTL